jgi:hypothetical protein
VLAKLYSFGFDITMGGSMKKNVKNEFNEETFASVKKEMAEATHGQVRKTRDTESRYCANSRTANCYHAGTVAKIIPSPRPTGKGTDCC